MDFDVAGTTSPTTVPTRSITQMTLSLPLENGQIE
jgi:hypothetical protein